MNAINFIAKHLDPVWVTDPVHNVDTVCAFTGQPIKQGVRKKDAIGSLFTDHAYLRYPSDYISIDAYLCIKSVIETEKGANALRNYSCGFGNKKADGLGRLYKLAKTAIL